MPSRPGAPFLPGAAFLRVAPPPAAGGGGGGVTSAYGRSGAVVGQEGDYTLDQMSDVDTATTPPTANNLLHWDGTNWVPTAVVDSGVYVGP